MSILGIDYLNESEKNILSEDSLRQRALIKQSMLRFWKSNNPLETDEDLLEDIQEAAGDYPTVAKLLKDHLALDKLSNLKLNQAGLLKSKEGTEIMGNIKNVANSLGLEVASIELAVNFTFLYNQVISFCKIDKPPKEIRGSSRGTLSKKFDRLYIHSNIIEPVDVNDQVSDVLRVVKSRGKRGKTTQETFSRPYYHPVKKGGKISLIHVNIRGANGDLVPFAGGTVLLTLQFRKRRI